MLKKRPKIIAINSLVSQEYLSIRAIVGIEPLTLNKEIKVTPLSRIRLLKKNKFNIHVKFDGQEFFLETDQYGHFSHRLKVKSFSKQKEFNLYAKSQGDSTAYFLGSFKPSELQKEKKIVISDFDKTLVETKYKTIAEVYQSLTSPVSDFPSLNKSVELLKSKIDSGYLPFILSSSPNFYRPTIKEWLDSNDIPSNNVFLKDYRQFLSIFPTDLFIKDISSHGVHKLSQLINIYLMTNIPAKIFLMGDNSESDPVIYCIFSKIAADDFYPDDLWQEIKSRKEFLFTNSQSLKFLNKLYQAKNLNKKREKITETEIYIRKVPGKSLKKVPQFLEYYYQKIIFFED